MNSDDSPNIDFSGHYARLELSDQASWANARNKYRQLVNRWHPDRFEQKPRERAHAQQQFIEMAKSYNALRSFYRTNHRMPFQSLEAAAAAETSSQGKPTDYGDADIWRDSDVIPEAGIFAGGSASSERKKREKNHRSKHRMWLAVAASLLVATVLFFLIVDQITTQAVMERGREVVEQAPESEFMPSAAEIRRSQSRGAFVTLP